MIQKGNGNGDDGEVLDENKDFKLSCLFSFAFCSCVAGSISFCPQPKAMARVSSLLNSLFFSSFQKSGVYHSDIIKMIIITLMNICAVFSESIWCDIQKKIVDIEYCKDCQLSSHSQNNIISGVEYQPYNSDFPFAKYYVSLHFVLGVSPLSSKWSSLHRRIIFAVLSASIWCDIQ